MRSSCRRHATSLDETAQKVLSVKNLAKEQGTELGVYTVGVITCRPTRKEAEEYWHYSIVEHADWRAVDDILALKNITARTRPRRSSSRSATAMRRGWAACRSLGPDHVANQLIDLSKAGLTGVAVSLVNYIDELPFFCDEVLPRLERAGCGKNAEQGRHMNARVGLIIPSSNRWSSRRWCRRFRMA